MRLAHMGCRQANREGPGVTQGLLPYSRKHGARVARLRCPILRGSQRIVMFSFDRYQMKVTDESQDPAGSRQSDKRIFRTAGHKFSPALGTIIIILVAAKGRARSFPMEELG